MVRPGGSSVNESESISEADRAARLESFQEPEGYPGDLVFYSLADPAPPTLAKRGSDAE